MSSNSPASTNCSPPPSSTTDNAESLLSILESLHAHLTHQTSLLPPLIHRLGLPPSTLTTELESLQASLVSSVDSSIEARRIQVREWEAKCEGVEEWCERLTRALGKESKKRLEEVRCEEVLPKRYEMSCEFQEKLRQMYHAKLEQLTNLSNRILLLSKSLSAGFYGQDVMNHTLAPGEDANDDNAHRDVTPERFARLEKELVRGKVEVNKRLNELATLFGQLDWMYTELGIKPPHPNGDNDDDDDDPFTSYTPSRPSSSSNANNLLPIQTRTTLLSEEEQYQIIFHSYLRTVSTSISTNPESLDENPLLGVQGVDPTPALINWAVNAIKSLETLKAQREAHIQALYDALEPLWRRMGVPEEAIDAFVEHHRGSTEETIKEYEAELKRMEDLRRESLGDFITSAREEIRALWSELMYPEDEEKGYAPFEDDEATEELLLIHEDEVRRLKEEKRLKGTLLTSVKKYLDVVEEEKELLRAASDQTRLLGRGVGGKEKRDPGRLLREEKMRKRVAKEKPRLEQDLLATLPVWEEETGSEFLVFGESMLKILRDSISERETTVTTRSKSRTASGTGPVGGTWTRSGSVPPPQQSSSMMNGNGKRGTSVGPGPGGGGPPNKRQKLAQSQPPPPQSQRVPSTAQKKSAHTRIPSSGAGVAGGRRVVSGAPRLSPKKPPTGSLGMSGLGHGRLPTGHPFARQKRESFKPRPSTDLAPPLKTGFGGRMVSKVTVKEEDEG